MIRALIIDDELHAREEMEVLLSEVGNVEIVGTCANAVEALKLINRLQPDVLFLDIEMPVINGFELLNMVNSQIMPHVVFVTAYDQYSLKAFEEKTLDYLLKPVDPRRLKKTIIKMEQTIRENSPPKYEVEPIAKIPCLMGNRIKLIDVDDVDYISTKPSGVQVTVGECEYYTEVTLKTFEERTSLLRCHKQYLINIDAIAEIVLLEGGLAQIKTRTNNAVPVSRRYLKLIKKKLLL